MIQTRRSSQGRRERQKAKGRHVRTQRRWLQPERLEERMMLAANPFHNGFWPEDVDNSLKVTPADVLYIVNELNHSGSRALVTPEAALPEMADVPYFTDVSGEGELTPLDVLRVVNLLNLGEGETAPSDVVRYRVDAMGDDGNPLLSYNSGGSSAWSVAVGNFNADGKIDVAVANAASNTIGVLLGNGGGEFAAAVTYATGGASPKAVAVGDFNADGRVDLAVANSATVGNNIGILLGDGAGGFTPAVTYASGGNGASSLAVSDFNGDGKLDLAVANTTTAGNNIGILLGNGAGGFAAAVTYASGGTAASSITAGDFNADGRRDLAVANRSSNNVGVLLGNGAGGFANAVTYGSGGTTPSSLTVGDFNADGRSDLAVANAGFASNSIGVLLGTGTGTFGGAVTYASGGLMPSSLTVGDFNADGKTDLTVANTDSNSVGVLLGNGVGGFAAAAIYASSGAKPASVTAAGAGSGFGRGGWRFQRGRNARPHRRQFVPP